MSRVIATVRKAQRRRTMARFVRAGGAALTAGAVIAIALVVIDRLLSLGWSPWLLIGGPLAAGVAASIAYALLADRSLLRAAAEVDEALDLDDRLGSAIALQARSGDDPFAALAVADGERIASSVRVGAAAPIVFGGSWWVWPVVLAIAVAGAIFLPAFDLAQRRQQETQRAERTAERESAAADVAEARRALTPENVVTSDLATPTDLETLEELERQLASGEVDPDAARAKAAGALDDAADALERAAEREDRALDALRDQLKGLDAADAERASPLSKALSAGDYAEAQRILEDHQRRLDELDDQERRKLAEELEKLAEAMDEASSPDEAPAPTTSGAEQSLRDLGVPEETIDQLRDETDAAPIRDALREEGIDEPIAETLADRLAEENRERQAEEQARRDAEELKEALRDAAKETRDTEPAPEPSPRETPDSQTPPDQSAPPPPQSEAPAREDQSSDPGESQPDSSQEGPRQSEPRPGEESPQPQPGEQAPPSGEPQRTPQESPKEGGDQPQPQQRPTETPQQTPDPNAPKGGEQGAPEPGQEAPPSESPAQPDAPTEGEAPSAQETPDPSAPPAPDGQIPDGQTPEGQSPSGEEGAGDTPDAQGLERARRKLEELQRRRQGAQENRESAEEARRRAREMLDRMSPEQREQFERWAKELAREQSPTPPSSRPDPAEFARDPVDLRPEESAPDRVIAQWFNPDAPPGDSGDTSRRVVDDQLQDAARGAERAVEEQAVHRRYSEIIKRYFDAARKRAPAPERQDGN